MTHQLKWNEVNGEWIAQASSDVGGEYIIQHRRHDLKSPPWFEVLYFDVAIPGSCRTPGTILHRTGHYLRPASATLEQARALAQADHDELTATQQVA